MPRVQQSDDRLMQIRKQEQLNAIRKNKLNMKPKNKYNKDVDDLLHLLQRIPVDQYYKSQPQSGGALPALVIPLVTSLISAYGPQLLEKAYNKITGGGKSDKRKQIQYIADFIGKYPQAVNDLFRL